MIRKLEYPCAIGGHAEDVKVTTTCRGKSKDISSWRIPGISVDEVTLRKFGLILQFVIRLPELLRAIHFRERVNNVLPVGADR